MSMMSAGTVMEKLTTLLKLTGYIKHMIPVSSSVRYTYGVTGTFLRENIRTNWWNSVVLGQANTFPVEGNADLLDFYRDVSELLCNKLPFSVASIEQRSAEDVTTKTQPNRLLFDSVSSTDLKLQHFIVPSLSGQGYDEVLGARLQWWKQFSGNPSSFKLSDGGTEGSLNCNHVQYQFPWGPETIETVINKGDNSLKDRAEKSEDNYQCKHGRKMVYPHQIECETSLEVAMVTYLFDSYRERELRVKKSEQTETRQVLQVHPVLAPFKAAIATSGTQSRELREVASYITHDLRNAGISVLDIEDSTSLDSQTQRNDSMGIPFTVIVNDTTLDTGVINLRNRDTTLKEQLAVSKVVDSIKRYLDN